MGIINSLASGALTINNATCNVVSWSIIFAVLAFVFICMSVSCKSDVSTALYNRVLQMKKGKSTFSGIVSIVVASILFVINVSMSILGAFVFTPETNYQIMWVVSNIFDGILSGLAILTVVWILYFLVLCHTVTVFSRLIYCVKLASHTPHTLAGYYAASIESWFNEPKKCKIGYAKIYHLNEELFEKALKDGELIEKKINESNTWKNADIEDQTELIRHLTRSMYYAHETRLDTFVFLGYSDYYEVLSKLEISKDDFDFTPAE